MGTFQRSSAMHVAPANPHVPDLTPLESSDEHSDARREFRWFDRALAAVLLVIGSPLFLAVGLLVLLADGRPIFYRGTRLGRGRTRFDILKFRTLKQGAQAQVGGRVLSASDRLEIPFGKALRACRLDELPQLINILRGDMNFWGPRPERPEVYLEQCVQLDGYDRRFRVSPGLIGVSQLFTPHRTSKRLRVRLDNGTITEPPGTLRQMQIIAYTMLCTLRTLFRSAITWARDLIARRLLGRERRRAQRRVCPRGAVLAPVSTETDFPEAAFRAVEGASEPPLEIVDLNESHVRVRNPGNAPLAATRRVHMRLPVRRNGRLRHQSARCVVAMDEQRSDHPEKEVVFQYDPEGSYSEYVVHQYFLRNSLATPARFVGKRGR